MAKIKAPTAMLVFMVVVFFGLYLLTVYFGDFNSDNADKSAQNIFVMNAENGAVEFALADDAIELDKGNFKVVLDTTLSEMLDSIPGAGELKQMLNWRITDFNKADFMNFVSDPKLWSEPVTRLSRAMRLKPYLGINMMLTMSELTTADQRKIEVFFDNFARNMRLRNLSVMVTVTPAVLAPKDEPAPVVAAAPVVPEVKVADEPQVIGVMNPDPTTEVDMAIDEEGNAIPASEWRQKQADAKAKADAVAASETQSLPPEPTFLETLAYAADFVMLYDVTERAAAKTLLEPVPAAKRMLLERYTLPGYKGRYVLTHQPEKMTFKPYVRKSVQPPKPRDAMPLSDTERQFANALSAKETHGHHLRINKDIFINRADRQIEIPALLNLSSGVIEVLMCDPEKGRVHESLLVSKAKPLDLQVALYLLGVQNGTPSDVNNDSSIRKGDPVEVFVYPHGSPDSFRVQDWIVTNDDFQPLKNAQVIFVGSGFRNNQCLADQEGNLIDINSMDANTILWLDNPDATAGTVYSARSAVIPRYVGDRFPLPFKEMGSAPVRPEIPKELEIPVTVIIRPIR